MDFHNHSRSSNTHQEPTRQGWSTLRFRANLSYTSPPAPLPRRSSSSSSCQTPSGTETMLTHFMNGELARNQLLSGTGNLHPSSMRSLTNHEAMALYVRWQKEARRLLSSPAEMTTRLPWGDKTKHVDFIRLRMQTSFLVFTIVATAILGHHVQLDKSLLSPQLSPETNQVDNNNDNHNSSSFVTIQTPQHVLLLLQEDFQVQGPPPLVWIFEQLTGAQNKQQQQHTHHGMFRYWAESISKDRVIFRSETQAEIGFEFPSLLLKILPVPKEVIEEQGNASLKKSMERDVSAGMEKLREAYLRWLDTLR